MESLENVVLKAFYLFRLFVRNSQRFTNQLD